ncbi:hypothetical protein JCM19232_5009 [Vibrio ishigakensis]|uniref:Uncharacterized protein n=1 Tax=Vibrio ishigakensis TaxID=1481914 RepID=A0A0B8PS95_9VIBR|nr:hypothetical protein JCM19232_5009 [Vibrio ishigakensis]
MIEWYASFSKGHPIVHKAIVSGIMIAIIGTIVMTLHYESGIGLLILLGFLPVLLFFGGASEYKKKYLQG